MLKLIDPDRALALVLEHAAPLPAIAVPQGEALGLILAEEVCADRDYPPFDRAAMDGLAVRVADAGRTVQVVAQVAAGQLSTAEVAPGRAVEIMTGAPCPAGTEAVVMREQAHREANTARLPAAITRGQHVARRGSECAAGQLLCSPGATLTPLALAVLASVGRDPVRVRPRPTLAVITTGDELARPGSAPGAAQIRDSNGPMLAALARGAGVGAVRLLHAGDTLEELARALAAAGTADVVLLSGGVSAGHFDLVPAALEAAGATPLLHKVTQKPGKPLLVARRGTQLLFGLPGNPLSAHFCFHRYVRPALRVAAGLSPGPRPGHGVLTAPLAMRGDRTLFVLARVEGPLPGGGEPRVTPLLGQGSADLFATWPADAYLRLEVGAAARPAGEAIDFEWIEGAR